MKTCFDAVLFDFDGTIVDSSEGIFKSLIYAFEADGKEAPPESMLRKFIGPPIYDSFKKNYGFSDEKIEWMIKKYRERYSVKGCSELKLYDGIEQLLKRLKENNIKVATASSKPVKFIERILDENNLRQYIDYVGGTNFDRIALGSGKTGILLNAMEHLGVTDKSRTVMVGDRKFDIDGAKGAGIKTIAVLYGFGSREEFTRHGAEYIAETVGDIEKIIFGE